MKVSWLELAKKKLKDGGSIYVFFAPLNMYEIECWIRKNLTLKNIIVWWHPNLHSARTNYGNDRYKSSWDVVFYAVKGKTAKHGKNVSSEAWKFDGCGMDVQKYWQPRPLLHKAQKPLRLLEKFITVSSCKGELVVDPFVGSGVTAIACFRTDRMFKGCDRNEEFVRLAQRRLELYSICKDLQRVDKMMMHEQKRIQKKDNNSSFASSKLKKPKHKHPVQVIF